MIFPDTIATCSLKCNGVWLTIDVSEPGRAIDIPANGGHYIAKLSEYVIKNGPVEFLQAGINLEYATGLTEEQQRHLIQWIPRAGLVAVIDVLCGRATPHVRNVVFLDPAHMDQDPQRRDMPFFRKRCRYDVLRVMHNKLAQSSGELELSLKTIRASGLLTRIYSDDDLASVLTFWNEKGIVRGLAFGNTCLIDEHRDDEIDRLIHGYDWEECHIAAKARSETAAAELDAFVCHASEDKEGFVRRLVEVLRQADVTVWYDEFSLKLGDSLRQSIDRGLSQSRFGIVVLSPAFFQKRWPQIELDGLVEREVAGRKVILPIWHNVGHADVLGYSPPLANRIAAKSDEPMEDVLRKILDVVRANALE